MDGLLIFSLETLKKAGGFCAVVASNLSIVNFSELVIQASGRVLMPIHFHDIKQEVTEKALQVFAAKSRMMNCVDTSQEEESVLCAVAADALESSRSMTVWKRVTQPNPMTTRIKIDDMHRALPEGISAEEVFEGCARTLLELQSTKRLVAGDLDRIVNKLHSSS